MLSRIDFYFNSIRGAKTIFFFKYFLRWTRGWKIAKVEFSYWMHFKYLQRRNQNDIKRGGLVEKFSLVTNAFSIKDLLQFHTILCRAIFPFFLIFLPFYELWKFPFERFVFVIDFPTRTVEFTPVAHWAVCLWLKFYSGEI